jgi:hypothetical protein
VRLNKVKKIVFLLVLLTSACATKNTLKPPIDDANVNGVVLLFNEKRQHEPEGLVRMLVTRDFLRIDAGKEEDDFLLFDRNSRAIYNVVVDDETVLEVINKDQKIDSNKPLVWRVEQEQSHAVMSRGGQTKSEYRRYFVNDQDCRSVVSVADLLPEALEALREYRLALAKELNKGLQYQESGDDCYLAINVIEPGRHLQYGFPIREWDEQGYQRFLNDYKLGIMIPKRLFTLPKSYNRYAVE